MILYLENNLVVWHSKKLNMISLLTVETKYIAAGIYYKQLLWKKQMLNDYGFEQSVLTLLLW